MGMNGSSLAAAIACLVALSSARADVVHHVNGQQFPGVVVSEDEDRVVVRTSGGQVTLPRSAIVRIDRGDGASNAIIDLKTTLKGANMPGGLRAIVVAHEAGADDAELNDIFQGHEGFFVGSAPGLDPRQHTDALVHLEEMENAGFLSPKGEILAARIYLELEDGLKASDALSRAGPEALQDGETSQWARMFLKRLVRQLVQEGQYHEAVEQIERLELLANGEAAIHLPMIYLAEAARARAARDYEKALSILVGNLWPHSPEIARNRAYLTVREMTEWASRNGREQDARRWINRTIAPKMPMAALSAGYELYSSEAETLLRGQRPEQALELLGQIPAEERPEELATLWNRAEFESRQRAIGRTDPLALFELAQWAGENDLERHALMLLHELQDNDVLKDAARQQSQLIKERRDLMQLEQAIDYYEAGLMNEVIDLCNRMDLDEGRESPHQKEIRELAELARTELHIADEQKPYQAEAFYQQAERAYFLNRTDESWALIDLILRKFPDTPAAERSAELLPDVARQFELQLLEGGRLEIPSFDSAVSHATIRRSDKLDREIRRLLDAM